MYINQQVGMGVRVAYYTAFFGAAVVLYGWFLDTFAVGSFWAAKTWEHAFVGDMHVS